jgi:hypothetical protein
MGLQTAGCLGRSPCCRHRSRRCGPGRRSRPASGASAAWQAGQASRCTASGGGLSRPACILDAHPQSHLQSFNHAAMPLVCPQVPAPRGSWMPSRLLSKGADSMRAAIAAAGRCRRRGHCRHWRPPPPLTGASFMPPASIMLGCWACCLRLQGRRDAGMRQDDRLLPDRRQRGHSYLPGARGQGRASSGACSGQEHCQCSASPAAAPAAVEQRRSKAAQDIDPRRSPVEYNEGCEREHGHHSSDDAARNDRNGGRGARAAVAAWEGRGGLDGGEGLSLWGLGWWGGRLWWHDCRRMNCRVSRPGQCAALTHLLNQQRRL